MPYVAFDLDALNVVPHVAQAARLEPPMVTHGLVNLWAYCFRTGSDTVTEVHLRGFFGVDAVDALVAFDFLERSETGFRVRGAERYLRISEARSEAGKRRAKGARRDSSGRLVAGPAQPAVGGEVTSNTPANAGERTSKTPALTPSTEHRTPNTIKPTSAAPPLREPEDPLSSPESFFVAVQVERVEGGLPREKPPHPSKLGSWWSEMLMELNGRAELVVEAYRGFAQDPFWREKSPPLPFPGFMSQWRKYVPAEPAHHRARSAT